MATTSNSTRPKRNKTSKSSYQPVPSSSPPAAGQDEGSPFPGPDGHPTPKNASVMSYGKPKMTEEQKQAVECSLQQYKFHNRCLVTQEKGRTEYCHLVQRATPSETVHLLSEGWGLPQGGYFDVNAPENIVELVCLAATEHDSFDNKGLLLIPEEDYIKELTAAYKDWQNKGKNIEDSPYEFFSTSPNEGRTYRASAPSPRSCSDTLSSPSSYVAELETQIQNNSKLRSKLMPISDMGDETGGAMAIAERRAVGGVCERRGQGHRRAGRRIKAPVVRWPGFAAGANGPIPWLIQPISCVKTTSKAGEGPNRGEQKRAPVGRKRGFFLSRFAVEAAPRLPSVCLGNGLLALVSYTGGCRQQQKELKDQRRPGEGRTTASAQRLVQRGLVGQRVGAALRKPPSQIEQAELRVPTDLAAVPLMLQRDCSVLCMLNASRMHDFLLSCHALFNLPPNTPANSAARPKLRNAQTNSTARNGTINRHTVNAESSGSDRALFPPLAYSHQRPASLSTTLKTPHCTNPSPSRYVSRSAHTVPERRRADAAARVTNAAGMTGSHHARTPKPGEHNARVMRTSPLQRQNTSVLEQ
ncbi:hypothetical protein C8R47DRAFT_1077805 [Mycena vitilis]|nr:hypothetical protein C8R47DRAFT_1077805 [Mycena vitilis]